MRNVKRGQGVLPTVTAGAVVAAMILAAPGTAEAARKPPRPKAPKVRRIGGRTSVRNVTYLTFKRGISPATKNAVEEEFIHGLNAHRESGGPAQTTVIKHDRSGVLTVIVRIQFRPRWKATIQPSQERYPIYGKTWQTVTGQTVRIAAWPHDGWKATIWISQRAWNVYLSGDETSADSFTDPEDPLNHALLSGILLGNIATTLTTVGAGTESGTESD